MFAMIHKAVNTPAIRTASGAWRRVVAACCLVVMFSPVSATPPTPSARPPVVAVDAATHREVVEALAQKLHDDYAHADAGARMAAAIRSKLAAGGYDRVSAPEEFASTLQADIRAIVNDKHLRVSFDPRPISQPAQRPGNAPGPAAGQKMPPPPPGMMPDLSKENGAIRRVQILPGNVGYMEVNGMVPMANAAIDAAFAFLHRTDALIIDLRGNGGGDPETVAYYMSYLSEGDPYPVMHIHTRHEGIRETRTTKLDERTYGSKKPVFVLTSYMTFSGGEEFAYDVQATKRGSVIGELTGGGANPGMMQPLGRGFVVFLPYGYGVHPVTKSSWEGVGVKPDVPVAATLAPVEAHRLAVKRLQEHAGDPMEQAQLGAIAEHLAQEIKHSAAPAEYPLTDSLKELLGVYAPIGRGGPGPSIAYENGSLVLDPAGSKPSSRLVPIGNNAYHLEGLPEDFVATFTSAPNGKLRLLLQGSFPQAPLLEKQ